MIFFLVFGCFSVLAKVFCNTVTSPQIRIVDVATKASETRMIPHLVEYRNAFHPLFQQQNRYEQNTEPLKSYVIYDRYPSKIFKEWNSNPPTEFSASEHPILELNRQPNGEFPPDYYYQNNRQQLMPPAKPTLAYRSVYSNVIKVFDNSLEGLDPNRFQTERYVKPFERNFWKSQHPIYYEPIYNQQHFPQRQLHLPENFPKVFSPNDKFHFPSFQYPQLPKIFHPQGGYYDTFTINYDRDNTRHRDEVEVLPEVAVKQKKTFLCGFIRVNQRRFPENGPCSRSDDDLTLVLPEYPDYSNLPNDKIPVEHRRQHFQGKRIKRSEAYESKSRQKRNAFGYSGWSSPFSYENGYEGYFSDNYPSRGGGYNGRNRNQSYRNRYYGGSRYDEYDDDYQNDDSGSRGLTGYLTNGGRRYKNRKSNDDDEDNDDDDDDDNSNNNRDDDSDEEMERMNSNRRDNDRRNDERDRRKNNNNNDDDDYRDNRRNRNNRRYNNNNNNKRYNNDRYDYNNRNRYYGGNSNGYSSNGYGSGYGGYGSNYGGSFGSGGYGSSFGGNGGYGGYAGFGSF